jgi:hypothetical protein
MPCRSYDTDWFDIKKPTSNIEAINLKLEADRLAKMLCKAMTSLEKVDPELKTFKDQETKRWWTKHKNDDKDRREKEAKEKAKKELDEKLRQQALSKLTPEEIELFGLGKKEGKK